MIFVDLDSDIPRVLTAPLSPRVGKVRLKRGDTKCLAVYFCERGKFVDPPAGEHLLQAVMPGDEECDDVLGGSLEPAVDSEGRAYLKWCPDWAKLDEMAKVSAKCACLWPGGLSGMPGAMLPRKFDLQGELSWNNAGETCSTSIFSIGVQNDLVKGFAKVDPDAAETLLLGMGSYEVPAKKGVVSVSSEEVKNSVAWMAEGAFPFVRRYAGDEELGVNDVEMNAGAIGGLEVMLRGRASSATSHELKVLYVKERPKGSEAHEFPTMLCETRSVCVPAKRGKVIIDATNIGRELPWVPDDVLIGVRRKGGKEDLGVSEYYPVGRMLTTSGDFVVELSGAVSLPGTHELCLMFVKEWPAGAKCPIGSTCRTACRIVDLPEEKVTRVCVSGSGKSSRKVVDGVAHVGIGNALPFTPQCVFAVPIWEGGSARLGVQDWESAGAGLTRDGDVWFNLRGGGGGQHRLGLLFVG